MSDRSAVLSTLRLVLANPEVRRVQLANLGLKLGVWVYAVAIVVWAYEVGGAALVGTYAGIRLLCGAIWTPIGGAIADRVSRRNYLIVSHVLRLPLLCAAAAGVFFTPSVWAVLLPGVLLTMLGQTFRPAQAALLPTLVAEPRELTAANAMAETVQGIAGFIGPALGGLLVAWLGPAPVVLGSALGSCWAILLLRRVPRDRVGAAAPSGHTPAEESFLISVFGGFGAIRGDRHLVVLTGLFIVGGALAGVYQVALVVLAGEWLGNAAAVGWLNGLSGAAAIVGGIVLLAVGHRVPLGRLTLIGSLGYSATLAVLGLVPHMVAVVIAMLVIGVTVPATLIGPGTIPQRLTSRRLTARVVSAINAAGVAVTALGAFLTPLLLHHLGLRWSLVLVGAVTGVLVLVLGLWVPGLDARITNPRGLELLRDVDLFASLSPMLLEQVVHRLEPLTVRAGAMIVHQGAHSDRFYVIESGQVEVRQGERVLRREGPGEVFGEIGLLRDVPRTASVVALTDTVVLALPRADFLAVLADDESVRGLTDELVQRRLAT